MKYFKVGHMYNTPHNFEYIYVINAIKTMKNKNRH